MQRHVDVPADAGQRLVEFGRRGRLGRRAGRRRRLRFQLGHDGDGVGKYLSGGLAVSILVRGQLRLVVAQTPAEPGHRRSPRHAVVREVKELGVPIEVFTNQNASA